MLSNSNSHFHCEFRCVLFMNDVLSESRWNWLFSLVQRVGCSFACLEGGITVAFLRHTLSAEYALAAFYVDFLSVLQWSIHMLIYTSDTEFPNLFWSTSNSRTLSYWVWFGYCRGSQPFFSRLPLASFLT